MKNISLSDLLFIAFLALILTLPTNSAAFSYTNMIQNGDFEDGSTNWSGTIISLKKDGRWSKVLENSASTTSNITLKPNTTYNLRCVFMEKDKKTIHGAAYVGLKFFNSANQEITSSSTEAEQISASLIYSPYAGMWFHYMSYFDTPDNWDSLNINFKTGSSTAYCKLYIIRQDTNYTFYTEKIELFECPYREYIFNGSFENNSYSWDNWKFGWKDYKGTSQVISSSSSGCGSHHARLLGLGHDVGAICTYDKILIQPNTQYTFSGRFRFDKAPPVNPAVFGIRFYDKSGNMITGNYKENKLVYSTYIDMYSRYIPQEILGTDWSNWNLRFITHPKAYSAEIFIYKWCGDQGDNPTYMDVDQLSLTSDPDRTSIGNYGFEIVSDNSFTGWTGNYIISNSAFDGDYALEVNEANWAESDYIEVKGGAHYLFRTMVMEPQSLPGVNNAYFAFEFFDANRNSLMGTVPVENLTYSYYGTHWYSYLYGTPIDSSFEPDGEWKRFEKWFRVPETAKFIKARLWNAENNHATRFDNTEIIELKYSSAQEVGFKCMIAWFGNDEDWPVNGYWGITDKTKVFYPYIAHASDNSLNNYDEWMIDTVMFMSSFPAQNPTGWNTFLDRLFATSGDMKWFLNLNQAVVDVGNKLNDSTHKVNVIISLPILSVQFSTANFISVVSSPATNAKIADWYYDNVMQRWSNLQAQLPRLNLIGFYCEEEQPLYDNHDLLQQFRKRCVDNGLVFLASPYSQKKEVEVDGVLKYRDITGGSYYLPQFFDTHYIQPNYFYVQTNTASSLIDYSIIWSGINRCSIDLEWTGTHERIQAYFDKAKEYGMLKQDASFALYEVGGWLYPCAESTGDGRIIYDNLNDFLHNRE